MMKKMISFVFCAVFGLVSFGREIDLSKEFVPRENVRFENGQCVITGRAELLSKKPFDTLPDRKYTVAVKAKQLTGEKPSRLYICFQLYDNIGKVISSEMTEIVPGTETTLTAPLEKGSRTLQVADASRWTLQGRTIQYNAKKDLSDLPTRLFFYATPEKIEKQADHWLITLKSPVRRAFPSGISLRQGKQGGYFIIGGGNVSGRENVYRGFVKGIAQSSEYRKFRRGTAKASLQILANWDKNSEKQAMEISRITITEE